MVIPHVQDLQNSSPTCMRLIHGSLHIHVFSVMKCVFWFFFRLQISANALNAKRALARYSFGFSPGPEPSHSASAPSLLSLSSTCLHLLDGNEVEVAHVLEVGCTDQSCAWRSFRNPRSPSRSVRSIEDGNAITTTAHAHPSLHSRNPQHRQLHRGNSALQFSSNHRSNKFSASFR
jgi:hypothetical protein